MAFYNFDLSDGGSYIQQASALPSPQTSGQQTTNCFDTYGVSGCSDCSGCGGNCAKGCSKSYLTQKQTQDESLCCHYNTRKDLGTTDIACCGTGCGQVENMATCGVLAEDSRGSDKTDGCGVGHRIACTRSCSSRCLQFEDIPESNTTNYFPYMGVFQVHDNDKSDEGCNFSAKTCAASDNDCDQMLGDPGYKPWQNCIYDANKIAASATPKDLDDWSAQYESKSRNYDELMTKWCSQSVDTNCPQDPLDGTTPATCSRYFQIPEAGSTNRCSDWLLNKPEALQQNYVDAIASSYCSRYNTSECKCVNRGQDKVYRTSKYSFPFNDGCWYNPCTATYASHYFQPSDVNVALNPAQCPTDICANVIYAPDYRQTYIDDNNVDMDC